MAKLNDQRQSSPGYSEARKNYVTKRRLYELVDMLPAPPGMKKLSEKNETDKNYQGRTSGSLAWRLSRGETMNSSNEPHKWLFANNCETFTLKYSILKDNYESIDESSDSKTINRKEGWLAGIEKSEGGVFRKVEQDWKMVYLARSPESSEGNIKWTFESEDKNRLIHSVELHAICATFGQGTIHWEVTGFYKKTNEIKTIIIPDSSCFETSTLDGANRVTISATIGGGTNWQHAQLFRQSLDSSDEHSMAVKIRLRTVE